MNFFENQDRARQKTRQLLGLFIASVLTLVLGIYLATVGLLATIAPGLILGGCQASAIDAIAPVSQTMPALVATQSLNQTVSDAPPQLLAKRNSSRRSRSTSSSGFFDDSSSSSYSGSYSSRRRRRSNSASCRVATWVQPHIFLGVAAVIVPTILIASRYKINQFKSGGGVIAEEMGGRLLEGGTADELERMLLNVIEEMAIAAGMPLPAVYILDNEPGINAFAAGYTPNDAVIGVTRGCLEQLSRDELQGVIGHEFSHILNGDMRMNINLMGWLHGILCIYLVGRGIAHVTRYSDDKEGNAFAGFGIALIVLGSSGLFFGRLMQSAISRQREYLADASAVQFTRNPDGIASALEKIGGIGSRLEASYAQAASHMFFGNVLSNLWSGNWFATHPPIAQRVMQIRGLRPEDYAGSTESAAASAAAAVGVETGAMGFAGGSSRPIASPARSERQSPSAPASFTPVPEAIVEQVGKVAPDHQDHVQSLLKAIPTSIRSLLVSPQGATHLIYALMLDRQNPSNAQAQLEYLAQIADTTALSQIQDIQSQLSQLDARLYLPLLDLTLPALRQQSAADCTRVLKAVHQLAQVDGQWTLTEFVSYLVLQYRLQPHLGNVQPPTIEFKTINAVWEDCLVLMGALAQAGSADPSVIQRAFHGGLGRLPGAANNPLPDRPEPTNLAQIRGSLERLRRVTPQIKQGIVNACAHTVMVDQSVTLEEADLLRAILILLDCPIPPFLSAGSIPG